MAIALARAGAKVAILGRRHAEAEAAAAAIVAAGGQAIATPADVLRRDQLEAVRETVLRQWGHIDILVNAAGGNIPEATLGEGRPFFALSDDAFRQVLDLNLTGTVLPSQVFGAAMTDRKEEAPRGCIVTISSMAASRAMTRVVGYGAAKAAVENFTRWLAIELARTYGPHLRVNAVAPGFFIGDQNLTPRGETVIAHTPAGRFGAPDDLVGTLLWLCSPGARFVTGVVVPVDGGFSAFSGV
jgi:NAD(P)-dependent dehydrogenase (short-subunit alcohol dehydrogenase family)